MAANLVKAGHKVIGFDLSPASCDQARSGGRRASPPRRAEAVADAEVVVTMLPAGKHVLSVWTRDPARGEARHAAHRLLHHRRRERPQGARHARERARLPALDAPVSGGVGGAKAATLTFMAAARGGLRRGPSRSWRRWASSVVHCGEAGAGQAAKICNNMILGISMIGVAEAFVLAEKLGLSHQALFDVASTSSGQCWSLTTYCPVPGPVPASPANNGYKPGFAAALMLKDLRLAQEAALRRRRRDPARGRGGAALRPVQRLGHADDDFSGIINFLRGLAARS